MTLSSMKKFVFHKMIINSYDEFCFLCLQTHQELGVWIMIGYPGDFVLNSTLEYTTLWFETISSDSVTGFSGTSLRHCAENTFSRNIIKQTIKSIKIKMQTLALAIILTENLTLTLTLSLFTVECLFCAMVCSLVAWPQWRGRCELPYAAPAVQQKCIFRVVEFWWNTPKQ